MAVKKSTSEAPKAKKKAAPGHDEIKARAEEIFRERTAKDLPGTQEGDWLEAERQLVAGK